jgi:hypothetical protein
VKEDSMTTQPIPRTLNLESLVLLKGSHPANDGMCVMEAVAYVAGERHSDTPRCASTVIGAFLRTWNDDLDYTGRQRLKPYIPRLVGTRASKAVELRRAWMVTDWMVRVHTPAWLELGGMNEQADALRALPALDSDASATKAQPTLEVARAQASAAFSAARSAALSAAESAALSAAESAALSAAFCAAESAAFSAARSAALSAAESAALSAARSAAEQKLKPTVLSLQDSALELLGRLIEVREAA